MQRKHQFYTAVSFAILFVWASPVLRADLVIDEFDEITTGDWPIVSYSWSPVWEGPGTTDLELERVLGGSREAWVALSSDPQDPGVDAVVANLETDRGFLGLAGPDGARSSFGIKYLTLAGVAPDGTPDGYLAGYEGLRVDFASMSMPADGEWRAELFLGVRRIILDAVWVDEGPLQSLYMPFNAIPEFRFGFVGAEEISFVNFVFDAPEGAIYELDRMVAAVPEPATGILLGLGTILLIGRWYRHAKLSTGFL